MAEQKLILIVDDDYDLSDGIRAVLETQGHKVIQARDGQQGQQLIYQQRPDLVILDMMMPRKGGYPVLEHFRDLKKDAPPIMITANEGSRHKAYAEYLGVIDYIRKPFAMERLLEAVCSGLNPPEQPRGRARDEAVSVITPASGRSLAASSQISSTQATGFSAHCPPSGYGFRLVTPSARVALETLQSYSRRRDSRAASASRRPRFAGRALQGRSARTGHPRSHGGPQRGWNDSNSCGKLRRPLSKARAAANNLTSFPLIPPATCQGAPPSQIELRPGLADVPVAESAISFIDGKNARLEYRGVAVETLATESCFEETTYLLLKGDLPSQKQLADFDDQLRGHRRMKFRLIDLIKCLPETGHPMYALQAAVAAMGMFRTRLAMSPTPRATGSPRFAWLLLSGHCGCRLSWHPPRRRADCRTIWTTRPTYLMLFAANRRHPQGHRRLFDSARRAHDERLHVLGPRHRFDARQSVHRRRCRRHRHAAGAAARRANEEVLEAMLEEIAATANVRKWCDDAIANKKKIMGFGHRVYKVKDPRATVLQSLY